MADRRAGFGAVRCSDDPIRHGDPMIGAMCVLATVEIFKQENARAAGLPYVLEAQPDIYHNRSPVCFDDGDDWSGYSDGIETID
jgi:hypothetical protein